MKISNDLNALRSKILPLYRWGEFSPRRAYLQIDLLDATACVYVSCDQDGRTPIEVLEGRAEQFEIHNNIRGDAIADFLESPEFQSAVDGYCDEWYKSYEGRSDCADSAATSPEHVQEESDEQSGDAYERLCNLIESNLSPKMGDSSLLIDSCMPVVDVDNIADMLGEFRELWEGGMSLQEAIQFVEDLASNPYPNQYLDLDVGEYLLQRAYDIFCDRPASLDECHIDALLAAERISNERAVEWREEYLAVEE